MYWVYQDYFAFAKSLSNCPFPSDLQIFPIESLTTDFFLLAVQAAFTRLTYPLHLMTIINLHLTIFCWSSRHLSFPFCPPISLNTSAYAFLPQHISISVELGPLSPRNLHKSSPYISARVRSSQRQTIKPLSSLSPICSSNSRPSCNCKRCHNKRTHLFRRRAPSCSSRSVCKHFKQATNSNQKENARIKL